MRIIADQELDEIGPTERVVRVVVLVTVDKSKFDTFQNFLNQCTFACKDSNGNDIRTSVLEYYPNDFSN